MIRRVAAVGFATLALTLTGTAPAEAAYVEDPAYIGVRFPTANICVDDRTGSIWYYRVRDAVADFNSLSNVRMVRQVGRHACDSYASELILTWRNEGKTGWVGYARIYDDMSWGRTEHGNSTYVHGDVVLRLNSYYWQSYDGWRHILTHEMGHALGLRHTQALTCKSVMAQWPCTSYWLKLSAYDRAALVRIYEQ
jgi:predicted Zn-dependent protease